MSGWLFGNRAVGWAKGLVVMGLALLGARAEAGQKILLYKTPYGSGPVCVASSYLSTGCSNTAAAAMKARGDGWLAYDITSGLAAAGQYGSFTLYVPGNGNSVQGVGTAGLYDKFQSVDTVWMVPDPFPSGTSVKVYTSRPKAKVVMLWHPWPQVSKVPMMQLDGGAWAKMGSSLIMPGWYSRTILGYESFSLLFSDTAKAQYLGANGFQPLLPAATPFAVDDIAAQSDTIWIRPLNETSPTGLVASAVRPYPKTVFLFNPWEGSKPIHRPLITIDKVGPVAMSPNADYCGWYSYSWFDRAPSALFTDDHTKETFGATGIGSSAPLDITPTGDSLWISQLAGKPSLTRGPTSERGLCEVSYLAATIRDFPSDGSNREFARGRGCGKGGWDVVKGMVDPVLGSDHKPVRSRTDTGYMGIPNSWGGKDYGFRCTYDTVKGVSHLVGDEIGDTGIATSWFKTVPGKNAETCRDIPLTLDSVTGNYGFNADLPQDKRYYFPIDDFLNLPDGSSNPYYDQIQGGDGKLHNYSFCLESHGSFEYKKGQVFRFSGDDDVWFFINSRLVVDLGGIHGERSDSVLLDNIGRVITSRVNPDKTWETLYDTTWSASQKLVEGKTYPFDFFFCERNPNGSNMMIQTSMNMRTDARLQVMDTVRGEGQTSYDIYVSTTSGQGCQARTSVARATAVVRLVRPNGAVEVLKTGTWYGGITVDSLKGSVLVDSAAIVASTGLRLPPGRYSVQFVYLKDSTVVRDFGFTVPFTAGPRFVAKDPWSGTVGSSFLAEVASFNLVGRDSSQASFVLHPVKGLEFYRDSLLTQRIDSGTVLKTGVNTVSCSLWVKGTIPGTYALSIGQGAGDTADTWTDIVVLDKGIRFLDASGKVLPADSLAIEAMLGDTVRVWFETFAGLSSCTTCGTKVAVVSSSPFITASADTVLLVGGRGSVRLKGIGAVDGASLKLSVTTDPGMTGTRSPIAFRVKGPDSSFVSDRDGDGRADRFTVYLHHKWTPGSSLAFGWPDTAARVGAVKGKVTASPDSMSVQVDFDSGFAVATASGLSGKAGLYAWGTETPQTFRVLDRIAPVALSARLRYGRHGASDTLLVPLSEAVAPLAGNRALQLLGASGWAATAQVGQDLSMSGDTLRLLFAASAPLLCPVPGDSVRPFPAGDVSDAAGNVPGATPRSVAVQGGPRPPSVGWLQDRNGDGKVETAVARFVRPVRGALPSLSVSLSDGKAVQTRTGSVVRDPADSSLLVLTFSEALPFGWTAFLPGAAGLMDGDWDFPLRDSAAPTLRLATLRLTESYADPDTLMVVASEALGLEASRPWLQLLQKGAVADLPAASQRRHGDTLLWLMMPEDAIGVRAGDSVRFVPSGAVQDTFGNVPSPLAVWHRVTGGTRKPIAQLIPPLGLVRLPEGRTGTQPSALALVATKGDTASWSTWSPRGGYAADPVCPRGTCNGPELVLNAPVGLGLHVYDQLGTHVASGSWDIDSAALESLVRDRLGRTRVRISWNYRTASGARVADGIYLLRMVMMVPVDGTSERRVVNTLWKIGLGPEQKK